MTLMAHSSIQLRPWSLNDISDIVQLANNINIAKNMTDAFPNPYTYMDAEAFVRRVSTEIPQKVFAIAYNNKVVGSIGIFPKEDIHRKNAEIGYWLGEPYHGKGIMTEAVRLIVKYGFETFDIERIYAAPFRNNKASQRVLQKSGFILEAVLRMSIIKYNELQDETIYSIRKVDYIGEGW